RIGLPGHLVALYAECVRKPSARQERISFMAHTLLNWYFGWSLVLSAFLTGAGLGLYFHQDNFLGGYASFRRRIVRLGHISQAALGMMNVLYSVSARSAVCSSGADWHCVLPRAASICFVVGGITMPLVCYLTGWREGFRHLFFIPVTSLMLAVSLTLWS